MRTKPDPELLAFIDGWLIEFGVNPDQKFYSMDILTIVEGIENIFAARSGTKGNN